MGKRARNSFADKEVLVMLELVYEVELLEKTPEMKWQSELCFGDI